MELPGCNPEDAVSKLHDLARNTEGVWDRVSNEVVGLAKIAVDMNVIYIMINVCRCGPRRSFKQSKLFKERQFLLLPQCLLKRSNMSSIKQGPD
ncbi:hypothetical protein TNIN_147451 [Trichonephila inaurata madagascariensis]|uniref:Uncharacterized protein n=1 Tax=Trichonephila inaurata madagascariensis TaxID=2747483 RepID=A0A8X6XF85_9ARAC|nr:hypothetical protein TNIN_147451 [Trichonephila inaurata madagascariensis]